jgi:hypothetical protein
MANNTSNGERHRVPADLEDGRRPPVNVDLKEFFMACARTGTAQRGWLTADDVINCWPLDKLLEFFRKGDVPTVVTDQ